MTPILAESIYWHFPVLLVAVSLIYSATRYEDWGAILREAVSWGARMAVFLISIGVALYVATIIPLWATTTLVVIVALFVIYGSIHSWRQPPAKTATH